MTFRSELTLSADEVFAWHARPGALERYNPPWDPVVVVEKTGGIENGSRVVLRLKMGPFRRTWIAEHRDYDEGRSFCDVQVSGPFAHWVHTHSVEPLEKNASLLEDCIEFALPLGWFGKWLGSRAVRKKLERVFAYRHRTLRLDLKAHQPHQEKKHMRVLVSGATGLVGSDLSAFLSTGGHEVTALTRSKSAESDIVWDPATGHLEREKLNGFDAVVHLAGENIAAGRWTEEQKKRIKDSRVQGTKLLSEALANLDEPPKVLVAASAIGYYGNRGDEVMTESSTPGNSFLSEICVEWEKATTAAEEKGIRVVHLRIGVVLSPRGGALKKMLLPFKLGVGGKIGSGNQYMSWVSLDDVVGAIHHALQTVSVRGPVNAVSPNPVTNREFTKTLGRVLFRPTIFPMPSFAARLAFGEMADELLLASTRVQPVKLQESGYEFRHAGLEECLRYQLGKNTKPGAD